MMIHLNWRKSLKVCYTFIMLWMMGISVGLISLYFGAGKYLLPMFFSYFQFVPLLLFNILPPIFLMFFFYFLFNRVRISFVCTSIIMIGLSWVHYFKLMFRNDPLLFADLILFFESINMAGQYDVYLNWKMIAVLLAVMIGAIFSFFFVRMQISSVKLRLFSLAGLLIVGYILLKNYYWDDKLYTSIENYELVNRWSQTDQYVSKGFVYPFIYSAKTAIHKPPVGYDEIVVEQIVRNYKYSNIEENKKVHIIAIMLEAYNDFSKFPQIEFTKDVYAVWRELKGESYSGQLVTNIFAGNTVNTERSFLTGFTYLRNFRKPVASYVHYLQEQGYIVEGSHPSYDWFYNRKNINEYLGFKNYYFFENYYSKKANGEIANDKILFSEIIQLYEKQKSTKQPYFSFHVTYQNHGPYPTTNSSQTFIKNKGYSDETIHILNHYFAGIYDTNEQIKTLIDYFRAEDEPVVIVLFGDHNPWLGDHNRVYHELGINIDVSTEEGFYHYYNTPYIIWGNDRAKAVLGKDLSGEGPMIGPYFLMNELFFLLGYEGNEFMQISNELKKQIDVIHASRRYKEEGKLTEELTVENREKLEQFFHVQYYWMKKGKDRKFLDKT